MTMDSILMLFASSTKLVISFPVYCQVSEEYKVGDASPTSAIEGFPTILDCWGDEYIIDKVLGHVHMKVSIVKYSTKLVASRIRRC